MEKPIFILNYKDYFFKNNLKFRLINEQTQPVELYFFKEQNEMKDNDHNKIINSALELGKQHSWESVRLHAVAEATGISLNKERTYFREKEELVDAWFDRADSAMLQEAEEKDFQDT